MAPKNAIKKKSKVLKKKPIKKSTKTISEPVEMDNERNDDNDSDGSLDAIEFDSEY